MNSRHGNILVIVLAVALLISISAAGYFYWQTQQKTNSETPSATITPSQKTTTPTQQPTQDETINWKAYSKDFSDSAHPYPVAQIKYPQDLIYNETSLEGTADKQVTFTDSKGTPIFALYVSERNFLDDYNVQKARFGPLVSTVVNGLNAYHFQGDLRTTGYTDAYYFPAASGYAALWLISGGEPYRSIYNQVLPTFKFLSSNQAVGCEFGDAQICKLVKNAKAWAASNNFGEEPQDQIQVTVTCQNHNYTVCQGKTDGSQATGYQVRWENAPVDVQSATDLSASILHWVYNGGQQKFDYRSTFVQGNQGAIIFTHGSNDPALLAFLLSKTSSGWKIQLPVLTLYAHDAPDMGNSLLKYAQ